MTEPAIITAQSVVLTLQASERQRQCLLLLGPQDHQRPQEVAAAIKANTESVAMNGPMLGRAPIRKV